MRTFTCKCLKWHARAGDLRLLRLMARLEPAWPALAPGTAAALLRVLAKLVAERTALPRVLPWLWPLASAEGAAAAAAAAEAAAAAGAGADVRALLGEALAGAGDACDDAPLCQELRQLLGALRRAWGPAALSAGRTPGLGSPSRAGRGGRGAAAGAGLQGMAAELAEMEATLSAL
jgi:hypothetical protein